jgi:3-deoxy-D-manno-octulosonic-acid transferase
MVSELPLEAATMLIVLYSLALTVGLVVAAPWWLVRMVTTERYREGLRERLGRVPSALRGAAAGKKVIWLHAVSVGEVLAATRLVSELEAALGEGWLIAVSTTTRTGQKLARERFGVERVFYFPLDFAFATRSYLNALQPAALILTESELWPRLLHECGRRKIPTVVVNARVSDRSYARAMKFRGLWKQALGKNVTLFLAQSEQDAERLRSLGTTNVRAIGNLKYDVSAPAENRVAELIRDMAQGRRIIVAGSTVASTDPKIPSEEVQVMYSWMEGAYPMDALLVLAPRHPERFEEVWNYVYDYPSLRATDLLAGKTASSAVSRGYPEGGSFDAPDILLLDTIGDLAAVYSLASIAYVGGSMMKRGGHNPLEPAQYGVPVVMGDSYENFRDIVAKMLNDNAIIIAPDEIQLYLAFENLLQNPDEARALGERGRQVFLAQQGASTRAAEAILKVVKL